MTNRLQDISNGSMDAIDALLCLGFTVQRVPCLDEHYIIVQGEMHHVCTPEGAAIFTVMKEIGQNVEYHSHLIQQKGIESGS